MVTLSAIFLCSCAQRGLAPSVRTAPPASALSPIAKTMSRQTVNAIDAGDGDYSVKVLRARVDADPRDLAARLELARNYRKAGFPEVSLEHLRLACERAPESEEAHLALAKGLRESHRPAEAALILRTFSESHSLGSSVEVWAWLGVLEDEAGDWKAGEAAHRKALGLQPRRDDLLNNLGYSLLGQKRNAEATEIFREALKVNPRSLIARNNLATALAESPGAALGENAPEAVKSQSGPGAASAHNNLAVTLMEAGNYADARRELRTALTYDPHLPAAIRNLQVVSSLDGKPLESTMPHRPGFWSRISAVWKRHRAEKTKVAARDNDSGSPIASR